MEIRINLDDFIDISDNLAALNKQVKELQERGTELVEENRRLRGRLDSSGGEQPGTHQGVDSGAWAHAPILPEVRPQLGRNDSAFLSALYSAIKRVREAMKYGVISSQSPEWQAVERLMVEIVKGG